jgi:hypothetical protein
MHHSFESILCETGRRKVKEVTFVDCCRKWGRTDGHCGLFQANLYSTHDTALLSNCIGSTEIAVNWAAVQSSRASHSQISALVNKGCAENGSSHPYDISATNSDPCESSVFV